MSDCGHGFPKRENCTDCMDEGNIPARRVAVRGSPFRARRDGPCALCNDPILTGQLIYGRTDNSYIHYKHAPRGRTTRRSPS